MPFTRSSATPLEVGYTGLSDKIDALRRQIVLIGIGAAIVLLVALSTLI